jgi:predicted regulator of Ras-like GTPase activity (Roadblock/LC7/MglB family)
MNARQSLELLATVPGVAGAVLVDAGGAVLATSLPEDYPTDALSVMAQRVIEILNDGSGALKDVEAMLLKCSVIYLYGQKLGPNYLMVLCESTADVSGLRVAGAMTGKLLAQG